MPSNINPIAAGFVSDDPRFNERYGLGLGVGLPTPLPPRASASGPLPTAAAGANAGGAPPAPVVAATATDTAGSLTFGTGALPAAGAMVVVTFSIPWLAAPALAAPRSVLLTWLNAAGAGLGQAYVTALTTLGFTINCTVAPAAAQANTTYAISWFVIG